MSFTGSITDVEGARRAAGSVLMGQNILSVTAGSLSSVATAQASAATNGALLSICDQGWSIRAVQRGYQLASNYGASFSSNYTTLYDGLPSSVGHLRSPFGG